MLRKIFLWVVTAVALAYGGAKLYIAHSINRLAHEVVAGAAPVADIHYRGTTSSLFGGVVGLTGVTVQSLKTGKEYTIGAFKLKSDSVFDFLGMNIERGKVPKTLGVEFDKLTMPLSGEVIRRQHGGLGVMSDLHTPLGMLACGNRSHFSDSDLNEMGIYQFTANVRAEIHREPAKNDVRVMVHVDAPGLNVVDADVTFVEADGVLSPRDAMRGPPPLKSLVLKVRDQGWHQRVETFCAKQTGRTRAAYVNAHVAAVKAALAQMGIGVGNNLVAAYRHFLKDGGSMKLSLLPQSPVDLATLNLYGVQGVIDDLAPTLQVNGKTVKPLTLVSIKTKNAPSTMASVAAAPPAQKGDYKEIQLDTLGRHIGQQVRLTTDSHHVFAGKLLSVSGPVATLAVTTYRWTRQEIVLLPKVAKTELMIPAKAAKVAAH